MKYINIHIPQVILSIINTQFEDVKQVEKAKIIIGYLLYSYVMNRIPFPVYLPQSRSFKKSIVGRDEHYGIWQKLEEVGILEERPGRKFSKKYKICKHGRIKLDLLTCPTEELELKLPLSLRKRSVSNDPLSQFVKENLDRLEVNITGFENIIAQKVLLKHLNKKYLRDSKEVTIVKHEGKWKRYSTKQLDFEELKQFSEYIFTCIPINICKVLNSNASSISISSTNHRMHHVLTSIDKVMLPYIKYEGDNICQIDMANCQPLLFSRLLFKSIIESDHNDIGYNSYLNDFISSTLSLLCPQLKYEIRVFYSLCCRGRIYEYFARNYYKLERIVTKLERDSMKVVFLSAIYGNVRYKSNDFIKFESVFPTIANLIREFKLYMGLVFKENTSDNILSGYRISKSKGYKNDLEAGSDYLSLYMQRLEADIFIRNLLPVLKDNNLSVVPVHDSFICKLSEKDFIYKKISNELDALLGNEMYRLKTEEYYSSAVQLVA